MRATALWLCLACPLGGAEPAAAQRVEVGLLAGRVTDERGAAHDAVTLAPSLTWADDQTALRVGGQGTAFQQGWYGSAEVGLGLTLARRGPLSLGLGGEALVAASGAGYGAVRGALQPRLGVRAGWWGLEAGPVWAGGGERTGAGGGPTGWLPGRDREEAEPSWRGERGLSTAAWATRGPLTARGQWRAREIAGTRWQEWSGEGELRLGVATLAARTGLRRGDDGPSQSWASGTVRVALGDRISLVAEAGGYPSDPLADRAAGSFASAGMVLRMGRLHAAGTPAPPAPRRHGDAVQLSLRAEPGARVELLADWTDWQPQPVTESAPGLYAVAVRLPPGVHRFGFRVNGRWRLPEGAEAEPDGFGGRRGVIRVD